MFSLLRSPCKILEPHNNPLLRKVTVGERKRQERFDIGGCYSYLSLLKYVLVVLQNYTQSQKKFFSAKALQLNFCHSFFLSCLATSQTRPDAYFILLSRSNFCVVFHRTEIEGVRTKNGK